MSSSKGKIQNPKKYVRRRGVARIDVIANRAIIEKWLDDQFNAEAIYYGLISNKLIGESYSYRTFLRALYDLIPKSRANISRPSKTRDTSVLVEESSEKTEIESPRNTEEVILPKKEIQCPRNVVVKTNVQTFAIPSNNITGDDD